MDFDAPTLGGALKAVFLSYLHKQPSKKYFFGAFQSNNILCQVNGTNTR